MARAFVSPRHQEIKLHNKNSQHESVPGTYFEFKRRVVARAEAATFSYLKVYDVVEESTTNTWQEHTAHGSIHPIATAAFPSCVISREVAQ